jgi:hypothetical protein
MKENRNTECLMILVLSFITFDGKSEAVRLFQKGVGGLSHKLSTCVELTSWANV